MNKDELKILENNRKIRKLKHKEFHRKVKKIQLNRFGKMKKREVHCIIWKKCIEEIYKEANDYYLMRPPYNVFFYYCLRAQNKNKLHCYKIKTEKLSKLFNMPYFRLISPHTEEDMEIKSKIKYLKDGKIKWTKELQDLYIKIYRRDNEIKEYYDES